MFFFSFEYVLEGIIFHSVQKVWLHLLICGFFLSLAKGTEISSWICTKGCVFVCKCFFFLQFCSCWLCCTCTYTCFFLLLCFNWDVSLGALGHSVGTDQISNLMTTISFHWRHHIVRHSRWHCWAPCLMLSNSSRWWSRSHRRWWPLFAAYHDTTFASFAVIVVQPNHRHLEHLLIKCHAMPWHLNWSGLVCDFDVHHSLTIQIAMVAFDVAAAESVTFVHRIVNRNHLRFHRYNPWLIQASCQNCCSSFELISIDRQIDLPLTSVRHAPIRESMFYRMRKTQQAFH